MFDNYGSHYKILRVMDKSDEMEVRHEDDIRASVEFLKAFIYVDVNKFDEKDEDLQKSVLEMDKLRH